MFCFILFVGFLCFSVGESNSTVAPTTVETTETALAFTLESQTTSTEQPGPSVIVGWRIAVTSLIDLTSNAAEMERLMHQIENLIPATHKNTTSITVRSIQKGLKRTIA